MTTTKIHVIVTEEDIKRGIPTAGTACPIALALKRTVSFETINIGTLYARIDQDKFPLPLSARAFIKAFDIDNPVKPFEFDLVPSYLGKYSND